MKDTAEPNIPRRDLQSGIDNDHSKDARNLHAILLADATPSPATTDDHPPADDASDCLSNPKVKTWEDKFQCEQKFVLTNYYSKDRIDKSNFAADVSKFTAHIKTEADYIQALKKTTADLNDMWTNFRSDDDIKKARQHYEAGYRETGIWLKDAKDGLTVSAAVYGFPAYKTLRPGDKLLALNDQPLKGKSAAEVEPLLEGKLGEKLRLDIETREGKKEVVTVPIVEPKEMESDAQIVTDKKSGKQFLALQLLAFNKMSCDELEERIKAIDPEKLKAISGVILDVRGDEGGGIPPLLRVADMFVPPDRDLLKLEDQSGSKIIQSRGFDEDDYTLNASTRHLLRDLPLVALVNGTTRSAPEFLLSALEEQHRIKAIIGTKSFGKGVVYDNSDAPSGVVKVTEELASTSSGKYWHEKGITPDYIIDNARDNDNDLQLERAKQVLAAP